MSFGLSFGLSLDRFGDRFGRRFSDHFANRIQALSSGGGTSPAAVNPLTNQTPPLTGNTIFPGDLDTMPFFDQGRTNGCGSTSLAMIMSYLGHQRTQSSIDHEIRRMNIFSSPHHLVDFARQQGLEAGMYNSGTLDELKGYVDKGIPTQCLISADGTGSLKTLHYVAVIGYGTDPATGKEFILLHDPNDPTNPVTGTAQTVVRMDRDEFMRKWSKPSGGFENFFIAYAPQGTDLPWSRTDGVEGSVATAESVADLVNGLDRIIHPDSAGGMVRGVLAVGTGLGGTVGGGLFAAVGVSGDWAHEKLDGIPVVSNLLNPLVDVWTGAGEIGGDLIHMTSETVDDMGEMVEKLGNGDVGGAVHEVGEMMVDVGKGVGAVVVDAGQGVVHAVRDFFRW